MGKIIPSVSVVIPVYNVENYLKECVDSVLCQTFRDIEIILVDDGSTDCSGKLCDNYLKIDERIKVIHQKNCGLSAARNTGLKVSAGEFIYFLDSDDFIEDETLEKLVKVFKEEKADCVFFDGEVFFDGCEDDPSISRFERKHHYQTVNGREMLLQLLKNEEYRTPVQMMIYRKDFLQKYHLSFYEGIIHEDELFTFQVFNADGRVAHCHEKLYQRRVRPGSIMTASGQLRRYESMKTIYFELCREYRNKKAAGEAARLYLIRTAKSVLGKYALLSDEDQKKKFNKQEEFKRDVMSHHGFGDMKLKIKCSGKVMNVVYRAENKFLRTVKKGSIK